LAKDTWNTNLPLDGGFEITERPGLAKAGILTEVSAEDDGKPTVMRYIIRNQKGVTEYWEGE
jgi:hypothetical protein